MAIHFLCIHFFLNMHATEIEKDTFCNMIKCHFYWWFDLLDHSFCTYAFMIPITAPIQLTDTHTLHRYVSLSPYIPLLSSQLSCKTQLTVFIMIM